MPTDAPLKFVPAEWHPYVIDGFGRIDRRYYELCVLWELRAALRAGDVWLEGSRRKTVQRDSGSDRPSWKCSCAASTMSCRAIQGKAIMENWLASGQEINGVAANNDEMALGALQAIKVAKKLGRSTAGATLSTSTFSFGSLP